MMANIFIKNKYFCTMFKNCFYILMAFLFVSCGKDPIPKPSGELRLEYPKAEYQKFDSNCAYGFDYSKFAKA